MSTHSIEEAQRLADTVLIMSHGRAVAAGPPASLVTEHAGNEVLEVYGPPARLGEVEAEAGAEGLRTRRTGTSVSILGVEAGNGFQLEGERRPANLALDRDACRRLRLRADARRDRVRARSRVGDADGAADRVGGRVGWACFGSSVTGFSKSFENFNYVVSAVLTPLFLVAGTFFPLDELSRWAQLLGNVNPLHHCVELVRHAAFGWAGWTDLLRLGARVAVGLVVWRIAIYATTRMLID
jgi:hypothetical protein